MKYPQHAEAMAAGARCEDCPLYGCGRGPVPPTRPRHPKLLIIGEAPGKHEVRQGRNFVGKSGDELQAGLIKGGLQTRDCHITNVLMCQPPDSFKDYQKQMSKSGKNDPVACCAPRLYRELEEVRPKVVLAVGAQALMSMATYHNIPYGKGEEDVGDLRIHSIFNQHGAPVELPKGKSSAGIEIIYSALHPAFAMRSAREYKYVIRNDIARAAAGAVRGAVVEHPYERHTFLEGPQSKLLQGIEAVVDRADACPFVACDIETDTIPAWRADIRCIGFAFREANGNEVAFVVPFKWRNGKKFWLSQKHEDRARELVKRLLRKSTVYHNGMFDTSVLLKHGFIDESARMDTWIDCYSDEDTEFLTGRGWLKYDEVESGDVLGTINPESNRFEWQAHQGRVSRSPRSDERFFRVEGQQTRCVVNGTHRLWIQRGRMISSQWVPDSWELETVEACLDGPSKIGVLNRAAEETSTQVNWYYVLLGLVISDGTFREYKGETQEFSISQEKGGRAEPLLTSLRRKFGLKKSEHVRDEEWRSHSLTECRWKSRDQDLAHRLRRDAGAKKPKHRFLPPRIFTASVGDRLSLLRGLMAGDGSELGRSEETFRYSSASKRLCDDVQALALSLGFNAIVHRCSNVWACQFFRGPQSRRMTPRLSGAHSNLAEVPPPTRLVCFSVPNTILVTRSGSKPAFHGNTLLLDLNTPACDLPRSLGAMTRRRFETRMWKEDADAKDATGVASDLALHIYCLQAGSQVLTPEGPRAIESLVTTRYAGQVLSMSTGGKIEWKSVTGWHRNRVRNQEWLAVRLSRLPTSYRGIVCTPDHEIYSARGRVEARALIPGDRIRVPEQALSQDQRQAILGTLLGASSMGWSPSVRAGPQVAFRASIQGGHQGRLSHLKAAQIPIRLGPAQPSKEVRISDRVGTAKDFIPFTSAATIEQQDLYLEYLSGGVTQQTLDALGPVGLAWWFMDDGCRQRGSEGVVLSIQRYSEEERAAILEWFRSRYGSGSIGSDGVLRLACGAARKLADEIAPYVFQDCRYKLPHGGAPWSDVPTLDLQKTEESYLAGLESVQPWTPGGSGKRHEYLRDTRWCIDVADNHNFFTPFGLVKNCCDDNIWTLRSARQLIPEVKQYDTALCSSIDHKLAPIYREAGDLGVWVNERVRGELSVKIRGILKEKRTEFLELTGLPQEFNMRSPPQVRKWLYEDLSLIPTVNSEGREYKPGDTPSTSIGAVLSIIDAGVDDRTEQALNAFLHYKSAEKLRSSYIENYKTVQAVDDFAGLCDQPPLFIDGEEIFPARPLLTHMRIQWRLGGTPSGRTSATPGIQTIPSKAYGGLNLKVLYQAPPGHCIVGADLEQVEGRIYAVESGDAVLLKAIKGGMDVHCLNAAMLFTEIPDPDHPTVMKEYHRIKGLPKKDREKLRGVAKTVLYGECLAEGTPVLTQRGLVPIEEIRPDHLLWDGTRYVAHGGAVCRGIKNVIEYDGVIATPDHDVWVGGEWVPLGTLAEEGKRGIHCVGKLLGRDLQKREHGPAEVWDILDCGPLHRFTVWSPLGPRLVSNSYGAEGDKLYEIFRTARDKGTLQRLFPNVTPQDAMKWHEAWHLTHPETRKWQRECEAFYRKHGYVVSRIHRRKRFFPGGPNKKNAIPNFFIQSTSGDIKNNAVLAIVDAIPFRKWSKYTGFILDIHDDLKVCVPLDKAEYAIRVIDEVFRWEFRGIEFPPDTPLATWDLAAQ